MQFANFIESAEDERKRLLASHNERDRALGALPVTMHATEVEGTVIDLPAVVNSGYRIVVVPLERRNSKQKTDDGKPMRNAGHWDSIVVASNHPSYPAPCRIIVPESSLVRGTRVTI